MLTFVYLKGYGDGKMNSKELYNEVYKVEGHNYGEIKDLKNTEIKLNSQLEVFKKYLDLYKIPDH